MTTSSRFRLTLPPPSSHPDDTTTIESNGAIVVIGANGSGKSRLGSWIEFNSEYKQDVHRISAQKSLEMPIAASPTDLDTAQYDLLYGYAKIAEVRDNFLNYKSTQRWRSKPDTFPLNDYQKLMVYLFSEDYEKSISYRRAAKSFKKRVAPPETKLDIIQRIWERILPHRELVIGSGKMETRIKREALSIYNASEMSDGERVIFYLIGQSLAAAENALIIIDEPELHLHRSIQTRLWNEIEAERNDCLFVYLTHDLDFATSRVTGKKIWLKGFDGKNWDWYTVPENENISEETLLEILGSRKPVIFIEGERNSLDYFIFSHLYRAFTITPCGGCEQVIHATRSFASLKNLHNLNCYGIVDRDYRSDQQVEYLRKINVFVLEVSEVENIFLAENVLRAVAVKLLIDDIDDMIDKVKQLVFASMERDKEKLISAMVNSEIEARLQRFDSKSQGESNIAQSFQNLVNSIEVNTIYEGFSAKINDILRNRDYDKAILIYDNKGLLYEFSHHFGMRGDDFISYLKRLVSSHEGTGVAAEMQKRIPKIPS